MAAVKKRKEIVEAVRVPPGFHGVSEGFGRFDKDVKR
jgi:hypothetical protein